MEGFQVSLYVLCLVHFSFQYFFLDSRKTQEEFRLKNFYIRKRCAVVIICILICLFLNIYIYIYIYFCSCSLPNNYGIIVSIYLFFFLRKKKEKKLGKVSNFQKLIVKILLTFLYKVNTIKKINYKNIIL